MGRSMNNGLDDSAFPLLFSIVGFHGCASRSSLCNPVHLNASSCFETTLILEDCQALADSVSGKGLGEEAALLDRYASGGR